MITDVVCQNTASPPAQVFGSFQEGVALAFVGRSVSAVESAVMTALVRTAGAQSRFAVESDPMAEFARWRSAVNQ